jgi:hypothetical protein
MPESYKIEKSDTKTVKKSKTKLADPEGNDLQEPTDEVKHKDKVQKSKVKTIKKSKTKIKKSTTVHTTKRKKDFIEKPKTALKDFSLIKAIKANPLYRISNRDGRARKILEDYKNSNDNAKTSKTFIVPGQLVLFKYLNPKNIEELEYYDASPLTIFFNIVNTENGRRVLGFNLHYFPPQLRYIIIDKIFEIYKPVYKKYFETGVNKDIDAFDYNYLIEALNRQNLGFAVRMYIPSLIGDTLIVPPEKWSDAMFTEGWFKKETRARIMQLFKGDAKKKGKNTTGTHAKGKKWETEHKKKKR